MIHIPVLGNAIAATALWVYSLVFFVNGFFYLVNVMQREQV